MTSLCVLISMIVSLTPSGVLFDDPARGDLGLAEIAKSPCTLPPSSSLCWCMLPWLTPAVENVYGSQSPDVPAQNA